MNHEVKHFIKKGLYVNFWLNSYFNRFSKFQMFFFSIMENDLFLMPGYKITRFNTPLRSDLSKRGSQTTVIQQYIV